MSAARIEKLEGLLARVQRNRRAPPRGPRRKPSTPLELAVESAELPLPSEPPPPAFLEKGTPPAGVKVTPSFAKLAIPDDDEPELVMSEPSGDYDVVIDDNDDDDGDDLPTVPPPPPEHVPAVIASSPGFEPVQLPPLPPSEPPAAIEALPPAAWVEPTPVEAPQPQEPLVARPIEAPAPMASAPIARVVAPAPTSQPAMFGELLDRTLALRPR